MSADVRPFFCPSPKTSEDQKKGHNVRRCPFFCPKTSENQKKIKGHHVRRPLFALKLSKIFRGRMILHVFTVHNAKKEDI